MYYGLYFYTFFRSFLPIQSFYASYLVETKKLKNSDIHNKAIPWFFATSLLISIFGSLLSRSFGNKCCLLIDVVADLALHIILCFMSENNVFIAGVTCGLSGISTSLAHISHCIVYEIEPNKSYRNKMMGKYQIIRKFCQIFSSFLAQNLRFDSGNNISSLYISVLFESISFIFGLFLKTKAKKDINSLFGYIYKHGFKTYILDLYTPKIFFYSLINIIGSIIYVSFSMYSNCIFIERRKNINFTSIIFAKYLYKFFYPLKFLSFILIKIFSYLDSRIEYENKVDKKSMLFGYIHGTCRLFTAILTYFVASATFSHDVQKVLCVLLVILTILLTVSLRYFTSIVSTYIIYMLGFACSNTLLSLSHTGYNKEDRLEEIITTNLFIASVIHVSITCISKYKQSTAAEKMYYYSSVGVMLFAVSLTVLSFGKP